MENRPDLEFQKILEMVKSHFAFLVPHGYQIISAMFTDPANQNWSVFLAKNNNLIRIHYHEKKIRITLGSEPLMDTVGMIDLHDLVHLLHGEVSPFQEHHTNLPDAAEQLRKTAWLLETHMEDILVIFRRLPTNVSFSQARKIPYSNARSFPFMKQQYHMKVGKEV